MRKEPEKVYSRRDFLKIVWVWFCAALTDSIIGNSGCTTQRKENKGRDTPTLIPPAEAPSLFPTPTEIPRIIILEELTNLVDLAEKYPLGFETEDPYYYWYSLNGGEKLFDPWSIPKGTELLIPSRNEELLGKRQGEIKEASWQYTLAQNNTSLGRSSEARLRNIRTAVNRLGGTVVLPYQLFSMNEAIGPFTGEPQPGDEGYGWGFGYTERGEVPMFAGGVCQIPSTLFKAAAEAGMLVIQRTPHLYHWRGYGAWDATIAEGVDFTFRNLYPFPVKIESYIKNNRLYVEIKSPQPSLYDKIVCETVFDQENPDGSWDGLVKQIVYFGGRVRVREYQSHYNPKPK